MKIEVFKCDDCGQLFENEKVYEKHKSEENSIKLLNALLPRSGDYTSGEFRKQWTKEQYTKYKNEVILEITNRGIATDYSPMSYGWFRCLDDSDSIFYGVACRILNICPECYREWDQQYSANNCQHADLLGRE